MVCQIFMIKVITFLEFNHVSAFSLKNKVVYVEYKGKRIVSISMNATK